MDHSRSVFTAERMRLRRRRRARVMLSAVVLLAVAILFVQAVVHALARQRETSAARAPQPLHRIESAARAQVARKQARPARVSSRRVQAFPFAARIAAARRYLEQRDGTTGFAVVDASGRLHGLNAQRQFITGSVVKAMLLVAYLRLLGREHERLGEAVRSLLYPMIHISDNDAATSVWEVVGDQGLHEVARAARMSDFTVSGDWGTALITPADQARFFLRMNRLIPRPFRSYAASLLSGIAGYESWGIPAIARPRGWTVYFKGGWRPTETGALINQIARLHRGRRTFALAVMTDGNPSYAYGIETVEGVTAALLGTRITSADLDDVAADLAQ